MKTPDEIVEEIRSDIEYEGKRNYEAYYHSNLYLDEIAKMSATEASKFLMAVLEKDEYMEGWVAAVLDSLREAACEYNLDQIWFAEILKHEELAIF
tara:strand:+ start:873 stop:1160 length:288 start_codon:yes stop_codon:yes gene_type:complete